MNLEGILSALMIIFVIVAGIVALISRHENGQLTTEKYKIRSPKIPESFDGFRIVFLTDLHNATYGYRNKELIKAIERCAPDLIVVGGDMIVRGEDSYDVPLDLLKQLAKKYMVYYADGNHELRWKWNEEVYGLKYKEYIHDLKECGVAHISNETVILEHESEYLFLVAMDLEKKFYTKFRPPRMKMADVRNALGKEPKQGFRIFVAHNPAYFESYARWGGDLVLSGHFHGGVIRLPKFGGVISPQLQLFPKYYAGKYKYKRSTMILSRGLGSHSIKVRVNNRPELSFITLEKTEDKQ